MVFRQVISNRLPLNDSKLTKKPKGIPRIAARRVELVLTLRETATISSSSLSRELTRFSAEIKLSAKKPIFILKY